MNEPFTVYSASAGSGKTTQLVSEYLKLCFRSSKPFQHIFRHILAITFTNNATAEMKERIIHTLTQFAFSDPSQFNGSLTKIYNDVKNACLQDDKYMRNKAKEILEAILYNFDDFSISTIDSFFQRIIRAFAYELNLNMNFNLEIQLDDLFNQTIDLLINKVSIAEDNNLTKKILNLLWKSMENNGKNKIEVDLQTILNTLFNEDSYYIFKFNSEEVEKNPDFYKTFFETYVKYYSDKKTITIQALANIESQLIRHYITKKNGDPLTGTDFRNKAFDKLKEVSDDETFISKISRITSISITSNGDEFAELLSQYYKDLNTYKEIRFITENLVSLSLMYDLKSIIEEIKAQDNLFYLTETNAKIADEIEADETPFIYEKIGNKYAYFFIDEFQDTSKLQWDNFIPLLKNALSGSQISNERGGVKIFGDVKQAIYRFRSGDSKLLHKLSTVEGVREELNLAKIEDHFYAFNNSLNTNYRSTKSIIDFNNKFFSKLLRTNILNDPIILSYYNELEQKLGNKAQSEIGFVSLLFKTANNLKPNNDYFKEEALNAVKECIENGYQYRDIAILTSGNDLGSTIGNYLLQNEIPVISSDSLLLKSSNDIGLLEAALFYLADANDNISKLTIAQYFTKDNQTDISEIISQIYEKNGDKNFQAYLKKMNIVLSREKLIQLQLYTIINELIKIFNLSKADPFIIKFLDCIDEYLSTKSGELSIFIDWWKEKSQNLSLAFPKKLNAVTVSTIHKAKGLSYPIVIFPFDNFSYRKTKETVWIKNNKEDDKEIDYFLGNLSASSIPTDYIEYEQNENRFSHLDVLNKLYVAHTRPEDGLYLLTGQFEVSRSLYVNALLEWMKQDIDFNDIKEEELLAPTIRFWYVNDKFVSTYDPHKKQQNPLTTEESAKISQIYTSNFSCNQNDFALSDAVQKSEQQKRGIYIHNFLSQLNNFPENEVEIDTLIDASDLEYKEEIKHYLKALINNREYAPYFQKGVQTFNEISILAENGKIVRPDRIVFMKDKVVVIDYKTGSPGDEMRKKYNIQIATYCAELERMGYSDVKGEIIYLEELINPS